MDIQGLNEFQKDMAPFAERIKNIQRRIDGLNQTLSREGQNMSLAQEELKTRFIQGVNSLKADYQGTLNGINIDGRWVSYRNAILKLVHDFKIQVTPEEVERVLNL